VFRNAKASVVHIANLATRQNLFTLDVLRIQQGTGSGFVWDRLGHVVTNFHVIEGGDTFVVRFADQSEREAKVVGVAPDKDLAVLKIDAAAGSLVPLVPGRSSELQVGQKVLALGNPFGLDHSLTVGVVSALDREIEAPNGRRISEVIQTDAAINPGNSGGPLLDSAGRLIGVNSAIFSPSGASAGIGFAIPVDTVTRLVPQLIRSGRPVQAGIGIVPLSDSYARRLGIEGVVLREVTPGSPADRAGLVGLQRVRFGGIRLGDVIVGVGGKPVRSLNDLLDAFERAGVGETVELRVQRDDSERSVRVKLVALE
jgi:S1-C subfamily serine protease